MASSGNVSGTDPQHELACIENLPVDVMFEILKLLPDIKSLLNFTRGSPSAFRAFKASLSNYNTVIKCVLSTEFEGHLPMAIKRLEATKIEGKPMRPYKTFPDVDYKWVILRFCNGFFRKEMSGRLCVPLQYFTLETANKLLSFHACVKNWVEVMAKRMSRGPSNGRAFGFGSQLSINYLDERESYRVTKMLYLTEIVSMLLPVVYPNWLWDTREDTPWKEFWAFFKPWEYLQFVEMQQVLFRLCQNKLREHYLYMNSPIGMSLRKIDIRMSWGETLERICRVLAFQAGLEALMEVVPSTRPAPKKSIYQSDILDVVGDLNGPLLLSSRYIEPDRDQLWPMYRNWLTFGYKHPEDMRYDGLEFYFPKFADNPAHPEDLKEGPLRCFLFDLMKYGEHHDLDSGALWPRDNPEFVMTSFLSAYRWDSEEWPLPSLHDLRQETETYLLTYLGDVVSKPNTYKPTFGAYEIGDPHLYGSV